MSWLTRRQAYGKAKKLLHLSWASQTHAGLPHRSIPVGKGHSYMCIQDTIAEGQVKLHQIFTREKSLRWNT